MLFPDASALTVSQWRERANQIAKVAAKEHPGNDPPMETLNLLVLDGTWNMV